MAITFPHLPDFADSFMQGAQSAQGIFESLQRSRLAKQQLKESETLLPSRQSLMRAQAEQATAKGQESTALAQILAHALGHGGDMSGIASAIKGSQPATADQLENLPVDKPLSANDLTKQGIPVVPQQNNETPSGLDPQAADMAAGVLHLPVGHNIVNGEMITTNPLTGIRHEKVAPSDKEKALNAQDVKNVGEMDKAAIAGGDAAQTLSSLKDITDNPLWQEMHPAKVFNKAQLAYYSQFGTPEQQDLAGRFYADAGQVIGNMAQQFKGGFRRGEQTLITGMKPNPGDPVGVQQGKIAALQMMNNFLTKRRKLASNYVRKDNISLPDALDRADDELKGDLVRKVATEKAGGKAGMQKSVDNQKDLLPPKITKEHVTEENIKETMRATGLSHDDVMKRLKEKGII